MAEDTKPKNRRSSAKPKDDEPTTGVPGTDDGPPVDWREDHPHIHAKKASEHVHPVDQADEDMDAQHVALDPLKQDSDPFDQGPEANRDIEPEGPPTPEEIDRPLAGRSSTGELPQAAFGDVVIDVETDSGIKLLKLFEVRAKNQQAARTYGAADRDIKKEMAELGHYNGQPINVRVGGHLFSLVATSDDKDIDSFTRKGSQRKAITHPE